MTQDRTGKGLRDKVSTMYHYVIELSVGEEGMEIALSRQIIEFHNPPRSVTPRAYIRQDKRIVFPLVLFGSSDCSLV